MSELVIENLKKTFKKRTVVQDVSLTIKSGEIVGLLGPNGAGKTTSFYMIVGLIPSDRGRISLDGANISKMPIHSRAKLGLSYLPQEPSIFRKMTVAENILAILELQDLTREKMNARLEGLLQELGISHIRNNPAISLSGGERRRVEIARCLASDPAFILLDEPFAGIDPIAVIDIQKIIKYLAEQKIGILITDHNVRETLGICDRAYIVNQGKILASGLPKTLANDQNVKDVYLGKDFYL
ncbi:MAG: putative lipopolysaccharide transport protein ATP-binding component of superfamily [Pseudomonadota bacterium]|jgi:lipopolysaccharide export system ATP-binding protein|uniref:Putative lipopolysaccharide transport protein B: ATP-binding component of ABC superfamily n=1 Tax=Candidatus Methylopumilus planktonicus TaxID=1581557 RepID=A0A0D6ETF1_9PROT|nr:LPS export ABC transporter ATP-binding protein [Candidatus Methylopumilus planktonicus]MCX7190886.1 LPS export ABC transporter ATP-binding protein [Candidatus Methylopumilus sp.]MDH4407653.1 LPS export ABC transporter ATP-binding protein [Candidatus Methylopumilus sp.]QDD06375.1 LPS export ABC transporter ATP-binding protein [Candidatus Methylopumilus planktonicus]QDD07709.1 LPS export ABC transporter ATP-binding protein [Candidatus Methylopumilus planktonicus]QDD09036.1 LPS export ABC tran